MQTPCQDDHAVLVIAAFATKLMTRSVLESQGMEVGNVISIEGITREELQFEQRCDPSYRQ